MTSRKPRGGLVGPISLIFLGIVVLVDTLGIYDIDYWDLLFSLWPIFLIAIGIDLLIGYRSRAGTVISAVLIVGLFAGGLYLYNQTEIRSASMTPRGTRYQQELAEVERAEIVIEPGVAQLKLTPLRDSNELISTNIDGWDEGSVAVDFRLSGGVARYIISTAEGIVFVPPFTGANMPTWDVGLTGKIPLDLTIETGVGDHTVDLTGLDLTNFELSYGVGRSIVTMPETGSFNALLAGGVGLQEIRLPESIAVKVETGIGLVGISVPDDFVLRDEIYYSPNYAGSDDQVTIRFEQGVGNISIQYAEGN